MSKKENDREVLGLLARIRESLKRPKKETVEEKVHEDAFDRDLSERLGKHLDQEDDSADLRESDEESEFAVDELEIVADGVLDPEEVEDAEETVEDVPDEDTVAAAEQALFSDLDALMARMTPDQRARFEEEMNAADDAVAEDTVTDAEESSEETNEASIVIAMPDQADTLRFDEVAEEKGKVSEVSEDTAEESMEERVEDKPSESAADHAA